MVKLFITVLTLPLLGSCMTLASLPEIVKYESARPAVDRLCKQEGGLKINLDLKQIDVLTIFGSPKQTRTNRQADIELKTIDFQQPLTIDELPNSTSSIFAPHIRIYSLLAAENVRAVDILIEGDFLKTHASECVWGICDRQNFYPEAGNPDGYYRYSLVPSSSSQCGRFEAMRNNVPRDRIGAANALEVIEARKKCIVTEFIAPSNTYRAPNKAFVRFYGKAGNDNIAQAIEILFDRSGHIDAYLRDFSNANTAPSRCKPDEGNLLERLAFVGP